MKVNNVELQIEAQMEMSQPALSCVMCPSWNLLLSRICPRLICLEQSSLKMSTTEQKM